MTKPALTYAWTVVALGVAVAIGAAVLWPAGGAPAPAFWACLCLAALASTFKVSLPGHDSSISPSFVFHLVAAAQFSCPETVAIAMVSGLIQALWNRQGKPALIQVGFNISTLAISNCLAYTMAHQAGSASGMAEHSLLLGVAGLVLVTVNTLMVSIVLCLLQRTSFVAAWQSLRSWVLPYYFGGGLLATVWVHTFDPPRLTFAVLAAISVYILNVCYREAVQCFNGLSGTHA
jgi:hypothetical protein